MKKVSFKNTICILTALPVVIIEFIVTWVAHRLSHLDALLLRCRTALLESTSLLDQEPPSRDIQIAELLHLWDTVSDFGLHLDRHMFETTEAGKCVIKTNPDRHLYAVNKPSREENLKRIENVLREMDPIALNSVISNAKRLTEKIKAAEP